MTRENIPNGKGEKRNNNIKVYYTLYFGSKLGKYSKKTKCRLANGDN